MLLLKASIHHGDSPQDPCSPVDKECNSQGWLSGCHRVGFSQCHWQSHTVILHQIPSFPGTELCMLHQTLICSSQLSNDYRPHFCNLMFSAYRLHCAWKILWHDPWNKTLLHALGIQSILLSKVYLQDILKVHYLHGM